jgi:hypothetical protein
MEFVGGLNDDEGRAGDQVMGLEQAIDRGFRDEVALRVSMTVESGPRIFAQKEPRFWVDGGHDGERPIRRSWSGLHSLIGRGSFAFGFSFESGS